MDSIVKDRNRIVHQLFTTFDLSESRNTEDLSSFLDQMHDKANSLFCDLKSLNEAIQEIGKSLGELELSPFPNDSLKNISIQSLIVNLIIFPYQSNKISTSGWVDLSKAGAFIHQQCLSDYLKSKKKYQVGCLKKLLIKTEIFDLIDEANQTFYRMKPEYYIEANKDGILNFCKRTVCPSGGESIFSQELNIQLTNESSLNEANPDC